MKTSDFKQEDELKKMKVADIKKHIKEFNEHYAIKGYSKLKKDQLINAVLTAQMRISKAMPKVEEKKTTKKKKLVVVEDKKPTPKATPKKKLTYEEAKKIKSNFGGLYFKWSTENIPILLWRKSNPFSSGDPSAKEIQKFTKSSLAKYRREFQSRHISDMKTEDEWKKMWRDFQDEIVKRLQN